MYMYIQAFPNDESPEFSIWLFADSEVFGGTYTWYRCIQTVCININSNPGMNSS